LLESVEAVERIVLVDLRQFPILNFYPIDSKDILRLIRKGELTNTGLTPRRFDAWLEADFDIRLTDIVIPIPAPPNTPVLASD
jgi:hypothetical protein